MRKPEIDNLLNAMLDAYPNIADLNISANRPLQVEAAGQLMPVQVKPMIESLTPFQTETFAFNLLNGDRRLIHNLIATGSCDASYQLGQRARFRVNVFQQRGTYSVVLRKMATAIPTIKDMNLPEAFNQIPQEKNGMILVCGATGSGKTTTLAAMLNEVNQTKAVHVVTLEDPIEFAHQNIKATFNQRELGTDFDDFASGLRAALRQAPKIILVGEMRDRDSVELGLKAAETGHLLVSTLHTIDAGQTMSRIVGMFSQEEEKQIRTRLADSVRWIVAQRLLPRVGGGRLAVHDILRNTIRTKDSILNGEADGKTFYEIQEGGKATYQMQTFDQAIADAYEKGLITEETAVTYCTRKAVVMRAIDRVKQTRGEKTNELEVMKIDTDYSKAVKSEKKPDKK